MTADTFDRSGPTPPSVPTRYDGFNPQWPFRLFNFEVSLNGQTISYQERTYLVGTIYNNVIAFRDAARDIPEWTYFLPFAPPGITAGTLTPEQFANAWERGEVGRVVGCKPGGKYAPYTYTLLLYPDGIGRYLHNGANLEFTWNWQQMGLESPEDLPHADIIELDSRTDGLFSRYCADIVEQQISRRLKNPFLEPGELQNNPFVFSCGSEEELRRVTLWICHSAPEIFPDSLNTGSEVRIAWYRAPTERRQARFGIVEANPNDAPRWRPNTRGRRRAEFEVVEENPYHSHDGKKLQMPRAQALMSEVYKRNAFTGWQWRRQSVRSPMRRDDYRLVPCEVSVLVYPPSAHERAEALLALSDWLEGKVPPKKRMRLLGLE